MKIGVLGLGSIGMRHATNLQKLGHDIYGYDPAEHQSWRDRVLAQADAFVIATPTREHYADLLSCLSTGKPVFCEKPLVSNQDELNMLTIKHAPLDNIMVGNNLRFRRCIKEAKPMIGDALWAGFTLAQHNDKPAYLRDGVTLNWGAHEIDLALHFFGPGKVDCASINKDDTIADIVIVHYRGCRSNIHLDYVTEQEIRTASAVTKHYQLGMNIRENRLSGIKIFQQWPTNFDQDYIDEMAAFIDRVEHDKSWPGATGEDAAAVCELIFDAKDWAGIA